MPSLSQITSLFRSNTTRIRRDGMPNGFFFHDLLWFGDAASKKIAVSRGFHIHPPDRTSFDESSLNLSISRLRLLLATLGTEYTLQLKYLVCSDYAYELEQYQKETATIDPRHSWQIWNRTERYARYQEAMESGQLRREILTLYFSRVIDSDPGFTLSAEALSEHFRQLAQREALGFEQVQLDALHSVFPDCTIKILGDHEHFSEYYRFLNPNVGATVPTDVFAGYEPAVSIQENCLFTDIVQPPNAGVSFTFDGFHHAMLVMRQLPTRIGPRSITSLMQLGFPDFEMTVNLYPQPLSKAVKKLEDGADHLEGDVKTVAKRTYSLSSQLGMAVERIKQFEEGHSLPINLFFGFRLWARNPETVISRARIVQNAFLAMSGSTAYHSTNPETARQLWFQTWPGWTYGDYRGYDLMTDDHTAAELLPWSASFSGRLDMAEAIYDSPSGGLVGLTTRVGDTPQHMLIFGVVGSGKSILLTDLWAQIAHQFSYKIIIEEGLSHVTTAQTAGADPIIVTPDGTTTINPFDVYGAPLSHEHIASTVGLCLQLLRENNPSDPSGLSRIQSTLTKHIQLLYNGVWEDWATRYPEESGIIARKAYALEQLRQTLPKQRNTFLDAWVESDHANHLDLTSIDEEAVAKFATNPSTRHLIRNVGFAYLRPEDMPTLTQLCELLTLTPIGGYEENPLAVDIGDRLSIWTSKGLYGSIFDGITTVRLDHHTIYIELGNIPDAMEELKAAMHFLFLNVNRQQIVKRPRAERKLVLMEEGARIIAMPGGAKATREYYAQMRKFGVVIITVFQQVDPLLKADETVRAAVLHNAKLILISAQPNPQAADTISKLLELSPTACHAIKHYPLPEHQSKGKKFSSFLMVAPDTRRPLVGTLRNIASQEVVYCGASDNELFDQRQTALQSYPDVVTGILTEARK
jgi:type IV secretion system protein TrbE